MHRFALVLMLVLNVVRVGCLTTRILWIWPEAVHLFLHSNLCNY